MADKSKVATIEGLNQKFRLPNEGDVRQDIDVLITTNEARKTSVLSEVDISPIVGGIINDKFSYSQDLVFSKAVPMLKKIIKIIYIKIGPPIIADVNHVSLKLMRMNGRREINLDLNIAFQSSTTGQRLILNGQIFLIFGISEVKNYWSKTVCFWMN